MATQTGTPPCSQVASQLSLSALESPVLPLLIVPTSFCFFLFYATTTFLLLLLVPGDAECLGMAQTCSWECSALLGHYEARQVVIYPTSLPACRAPDQWSSQASSLSLSEWALCEGCLSQAHSSMGACPGLPGGHLRLTFFQGVLGYYHSDVHRSWELVKSIKLKVEFSLSLSLSIF